MTRVNAAGNGSRPPALVVGFSIHGLAVARALARAGIPVHCLSDAAAATAPTAYTRYGRMHFRAGLNTGPLVQFLLDLAREIGSAERIVLFPTSDRIAKAIALGWAQLEPHYALSWAHCRDLVLELQRKDSLAKYCEAAGVDYPRSRVVDCQAACDAAVAELRFPLVAKPAQPLSSFKAIRIESAAALHALVVQYPADLPFVVQEWIEGPEPSLYACTTYLDHGRPAFMFTSRKIAASPPGLGQGTVFETVEERETPAIAARFLAQFDLSGPVAVEFKRDASGRYWLIEPNVGRTEYCVDLAIQSGYDLPVVEYLYAIGRGAEARVTSRTRSCVWFDTDKDPRCWLAHRGLLSSGGSRRAVFPFLGHDDWRPLVASTWQQIYGAVRTAGGDLLRRAGLRSANDVVRT